MKACLCLHRSCGAATVILQCPRPLLRTQAHLGQRVVLKQTVAARSGSLICDSLSTMAGCMAAVSNTAELGASIQAVSSPATCSQTDKQNKPNTTAILWFRRDLRLQDNSALVAACQSSSYLLPVYILDPREMEPRRSLKEGGLGVPKLGPHRCRFMLEAVQDLKQQLQDLGSDLIFHIGKPEDVIPQIIRQLTAAQQGIQHIALYHHLDVMPESVDLEDRVHAALAAAGGAAGASTSAHAYWGLTLYHPDDLPGFGGAAKRPQHASSMPRCNKDPSRLSALPDVMTNFRKAINASGTPVRPLQPTPAALPALPSGFGRSQSGSHHHPPQGSSFCGMTGGELPGSVLAAYQQAGPAAVEALQQLCKVTGLDLASLPPAGHHDPRSAFRLAAGSGSAMGRLRYFVWGVSGNPPQGEQQQAAGTQQVEAGQQLPTEAPQAPSPCSQSLPCSNLRLDLDAHPPPSLQYFTNTRAQAAGVDNSTKLSPFLAQGCATARQVYHEVAAVKQEAQRLGMPEAECDWLVMHLQIRDFYLFTALKEGAAVLEAGGLQHSPMQWEHSPQAFSKWAQSRTGVPFVDACMAELVATGWMSNRGRQNVASFLTKTLHQDWRLGAELFESLLVDHDVGVNYVNWNYFAGVGNDPRNRHFKTVTQGMQYDEAASLITSWIPALANLPTEFKHKPFSMTPEQQLAFSCRLGVDYPEPIIDPGSQIGVLGLKGKKAAAGAPSKAKPAKGAGK